MSRDFNIADKIHIADKSVEELLQLFSCDISNDDDFYETIAENIGRKSPGTLRGCLANVSGSRLRGALLGLGVSQSRDPGTIELITKHLEHDDEFVVSAAIDALILQDRKDHWSVVALHMRDASPYVRGAVLRFARFALGSSAAPILIEHLNDRDGVVRQNAIDELAELGDRAALVHIRPLLGDPSPDVREAAEYALQSIAGG